MNPMDMTDTEQDFWLGQLGKANRFNNWVFERIKPALKGDVLEVGCGTGTFTRLIAACGHKVTGVELNAAYVEEARARVLGNPDVTILQGDATAMAWDHPFDTVVLLDVLEHIAEDEAFLKRLGAALRPGGNIILKVPAGEWLFGPMDSAIGHFRRYSRKTLRDVLERAAFAQVQQEYFNAAGVPGWWLNGRVLKRTTPPQEQLALFEFLVPVLKQIEAVARPIGLSIIATATKPGAAA
jgi:SAM-dependent methyltransferase